MKKSFTLIEMLVAIFLLTLLLSTAMFAFKLFLKNGDNIQLQIPKKAMAYEWVNKSIAGFFPYINNNFKYIYNFNTNSIIYVSTHPLFYTHLVIVKIYKQKNNLIYTESPIYNKLQNYNNPIILKKQHFQTILYKNIKKFNISYEKTKNFPNKITFNVNNNKWIFHIHTTWYDLNNLLKAKSELQ